MSRGREATVATVQPRNLAGSDLGVGVSDGRVMTIPGQNVVESTERTIVVADAHE